jgi:hypothetical protein
VKIIDDEKPDIVAVSYRLTPDSAALLLAELERELSDAAIAGCRMIFGGTPPVVAVAARTGLFERLFDGTEPPGSVRDTSGAVPEGDSRSMPPDSLVERIKGKYPYPVIRHHFGRPSVQETIEGGAADSYGRRTRCYLTGPRPERTGTLLSPGGDGS